MQMILKRLHIASLIGVLILTSACQTTVLNFAPSQSEEPTDEVTQKSLGLGIWLVSDAPEIPCPGRVRRIVITRNWADFVVHFFLGGIYTTRRVKIYCE